ncbi:histidine phosphatase family protein [Nakamurella sp. YIM 132087]|uniref:Histidine phosphatase family protein n=1 Tax=Nakamurella alba TaxID=2665158 RepID=A0A7K1FQH2_9ACTN|nr:histidine phosphatase family protein [Nakamurella alba]MTD15609.1 histidine phosphatase family protein [Nakamurella alba]
MTLILIRHGQTPSNVLGLLDTALPGPGLTDLGLEQADAVPGRLAGVPLAAVVSSPARRAQQTAAPLAAGRGLPVQVVDGLQEVAAGDWEMTGDHDLVREYLRTLGSWMEGDLDAATPGPTGETGHAMFERFDAGLAAALELGDDVAVVAHGAIIRVWAGVRSTNIDPRFGGDHPLPNTGIVRLEPDPAGGWVCVDWDGQEIGMPELQADGTGDPTAEVVPGARRD